MSGCRGIRIRQLVFMSSGAAVNGHKDWSGYVLLKAAFNMMVQLSAHEFLASTSLHLHRAWYIRKCRTRSATTSTVHNFRQYRS